MTAVSRCRLGRGALVSGLLALPSIVAGQERLVGASAAVIAPVFSTWRFSRAVPNDSFMVRSVWQLSVPVSVTVRRGRVTIDAGGAVARGRVGLEDGRSFELSGLTDVRIRGVARVIGDQVLITAGLNAPVGSTRLTGREIDALGILGAPALDFTTPTLGNGLGATAGAVYVRRIGAWGVGFGSSFEIRGRYTPLEAQLAGVRAPADLRPGNAYRFSLGADRLIGRGRLSLLVEADLFSTSRLTVTSPGGDPVDSRYKLGPQVTGAAFLDLGVSGFRSFRLAIADRYRAKFTGFDGSKAAGSSGNVLEGSLEFVTGQTGTGLYLRADGRLDGGLEVDNTITTAAMTAGGVSVGVLTAIGRASLQPFARVRVGRLDTGPASTTATQLGGGIVLTVRP